MADPVNNPDNDFSDEVPTSIPALPSLTVDPTTGQTALSSLTPDQLAFINSGAMSNMSTLDSNAAIYSLNTSVTGCIRQGAVPNPLAQNDTCNLGFFCMASFN